MAGLSIAVVAIVVLAAMVAGEAPKISAAAFQDDMRKLWEDHVTWTRGVIVSVLAGLPDTGPTLERLLQNQDDIGDAIKPFYGSDAGEALAALLREHIMIAGEVLTAAKAGNSSGVSDALARWYDNGERIAAFLSTANPVHWPLDMMRSMMRSHLDLTLQEAVAYLNADYAGSIVAYDEVHVQILEMADMLSAGIVHQFPGRFTGVGSIHG